MRKLVPGILKSILIEVWIVTRLDIYAIAWLAQCSSSIVVSAESSAWGRRGCWGGQARSKHQPNTSQTCADLFSLLTSPLAECASSSLRHRLNNTNVSIPPVRTDSVVQEAPAAAWPPIHCDTAGAAEQSEPGGPVTSARMGGPGTHAVRLLGAAAQRLRKEPIDSDKRGVQEIVTRNTAPVPARHVRVCLRLRRLPSVCFDRIAHDRIPAPEPARGDIEMAERRREDD